MTRMLAARRGRRMAAVIVIVIALNMHSERIGTLRREGRSNKRPKYSASTLEIHVP